MNPGTHNYIIGPNRTLEGEIIWHSDALKNCIPPQYLKNNASWEHSTNKQQLRVTLNNNSFIKIDGAENPDSLRGYKPHFLGCDEFKDWSGESYEAMAPNLIANKAAVVMVGTPPDREGYYTRMRDFVLEEQATGNKRYFYMERPTETNPHIDKDWLAEIKRGYLKRGEERIWLREYMAKWIPGGANAVFPMFDRRKFVKPHGVIEGMIARDRRKLQWFTLSDPATSTCFANLFIAYNPYSKMVYVMDEIYEKDRNFTSTTKMWPRIKSVQEDLFDREVWETVCDNHEQWFINQVRDTYDEHIIPTQKNLGNKEQQLSLMKDMFNENMILISDRCEWFPWELENYVTKEDGTLPKVDDHLLDDFRYFIEHTRYNLPEEPDPEAGFRGQSGRRAISLEDDYRQWKMDKPQRLDIEDLIVDGGRRMESVLELQLKIAKLEGKVEAYSEALKEVRGYAFDAHKKIESLHQYLLDNPVSNPPVSDFAETPVQYSPDDNQSLDIQIPEGLPEVDMAAGVQSSYETVEEANRTAVQMNGSLEMNTDQIWEQEVEQY